MVIRNSLYNLLAQIIIKLISFGFMIFVVRQLGSTDFGKYSIATAFVGVLMVFCDLGLGSYVSREVARDEKQVEAVLGNMMALRFILAVAFIILTTLSAWLLGYEPDILFAIFLGASSQLLFAVQSSLDAVLIGSQRLGASAFASLVNQLVLVGTGTIILLLGFGFLGLSVASLLGILAATILNSLTVRKRIGNHRIIFTPRLWLKMIKSGLPFGINQFALSLTYRLDSIMLGLFWSSAVVGMYSAAYNLIFTLTTISNSVNLALFPHMSRQYAANPQEAKQNFGRYMRYLLILSLPMAAIGSVLAQDLAHFLFSKAYTDSGLALTILVWALPFMFLNELLGYIAATMGLERQMATIRLINAASNIATNCVAIPVWGLLGASITTVLTEAIGLMQFYWLLRGKGVYPATLGWVVKISLPATCAALVAVVLSGWQVLLVGGIALIVYFTGLFITGSIEKDELKAVGKAFSSKAGLAKPVEKSSVF